MPILPAQGRYVHDQSAKDRSETQEPSNLHGARNCSMRPGMLTQNGLKSRGWTLAMIKKFASSAEPVGELRLREVAEGMVEGDLRGSEGPKAIGPSGGHFRLTV